MSAGRIIARGFTSAHAALVGALFVFLLQAPLQVLSAVGQAVQAEAVRGEGRQPDTNFLLLSLSFSCGGLVLGLAAFFLFPLVQGGILGQVRDQIESPQQAPAPFWAYGRAFYRRLLGSQALFALVMFGVLVPAMCLSIGVTMQEMARAMPADGASPAPPPDPQQLTRQLLSNPAVLTVMAISSLLVSAICMVYWVANCIVVSERERVVASWGKALHFCRQNFAVVLVVWLMNVAAGILFAPLSLVAALGIVAGPLPVAALALLYSALIGYWAVLMAGLAMSLYLARRSPFGQLEPREPALVE